MTALPPLLCLHCERAPRSLLFGVRHLRLCDGCGSVRGIRRLYKRRGGWTPEWDAHIQRLVARAQQGLPVAVADPSYQLPTPPKKRLRKHPRRLPRQFRMSFDQI